MPRTNNLNVWALEHSEHMDFRTDVLAFPKRVCAHFHNLWEPLGEYIRDAEAVFGCIAWVTNEDILKHLSRVDCSIVVQKEDLWRPDGQSLSKERIRKLYEGLRCGLDRADLNWLLGKLQQEHTDQMRPIGCAGIHSPKNVTTPKMHHKFLVFCRVGWDYERHERIVMPYGVWTGSFNFTNNAINSLENAVFIKDRLLAERYLLEFGRVYAMSEPLDWELSYIAPDHWVEAT